MQGTLIYLQKADKVLGVPTIVEAEDLVLADAPDELSVMTYVGYFRAWSESGNSRSHHLCKCFLTNNHNALLDPFQFMAHGRGIEAPELGVSNQFQITLFSNVSKEPLALKEEQIKKAHW